MITGRVAVAGGCLVALLTAACSSVISGHPHVAPISPSPSSPSPTPSSSPSPAPSGPTVPPGPWVRITDHATGVSFLLPTKVRPIERPSPGTALVQRLHQFPIDGDRLGVSVGLLISPSRSVTFTRQMVDAYPGAIKKEFSQAGPTDAAILEKQHVSVQGNYGLRFRFAFTPLDHSKGRSLWFIEVVATDQALVILQTIDFPPRGVLTDESVVRAVNAKLDAGLRP